MNPEQSRTGRIRFSTDYWAQAWQALQQEACFRASQEKHPQRWQRFYNKEAATWEAITGGGEAAGKAIADALVARGVVSPKSSVLEIGCGAGSLSMALSDRVERITALDESPGMLAVLEERASLLPPDKLMTVQSDWLMYKPARIHDLSMAAFFPPAMTPSGLERLESHSRSKCALVVGTGKEAFPLRRAIWNKVMDPALAETGFHLTCAMGFLLASGRNPDLNHISWRARIDIEVPRAVRFFEGYFALFGKKGPGVSKAILKVVQSFDGNGRLQLEGLASAALITWKVPRPNKWA